MSGWYCFERVIAVYFILYLSSANFYVIFYIKDYSLAGAVVRLLAADAKV